MTQKTGGFMNMDYQYYNPRQAALTEARTLLTDAVRAAMADGSLPYSNSHSVVLTGYDSEGCYVADPMYEFSYASYEVFNWCYEARGSYAVVIVEQ